MMLCGATCSYHSYCRLLAVTCQSLASPGVPHAGYQLEVATLLVL
jgi:hypothetical protein